MLIWLTSPRDGPDFVSQLWDCKPMPPPTHPLAQAEPGISSLSLPSRWNCRPLPPFLMYFGEEGGGHWDSLFLLVPLVTLKIVKKDEFSTKCNQTDHHRMSGGRQEVSPGV